VILRGQGNCPRPTECLCELGSLETGARGTNPLRAARYCKSLSRFRQNATVTRSVVLSGRRDFYRGRTAVVREFGRLKNEYRLAPLRVRSLEPVGAH